MDRLTPGQTQPALRLDELAPMYRIEAGASETASAIHVIGNVADRLHRLSDAYGEWQRFEPEPYFDLRPRQAAELLHIAERVSTVHAIVYVDALLPSFQAALGWLLDDFMLDYRSGDAVRATATMVERWLRLTAVLTQVRTALAGDATFLSMNAATEERERWQHYWRETAPAGLPSVLAPAPAQIPSLTLALTFPLPAYRQPGRIRRLHRARANDHRKRRAKQAPGLF